MPLGAGVRAVLVPVGGGVAGVVGTLVEESPGELVLVLVGGVVVRRVVVEVVDRSGVVARGVLIRWVPSGAITTTAGGGLTVR